MDIQLILLNQIISTKESETEEKRERENLGLFL